MSNNFDLKDGQDKEAMAIALIEPMPTRRLCSRTQFLEEEEWRQRLTCVTEEDQCQQLTIDESKPTEGTNIGQVTHPHNMNEQDNKSMPVPPPLVPRTTAISLLLNLEAAQQGRRVLFSDEQTLLFKRRKKGFA